MTIDYRNRLGSRSATCVESDEAGRVVDPRHHRQTPTQVRVISASQLHREGGHHATQAADTDVANGAPPPPPPPQRH